MNGQRTLRSGTLKGNGAKTWLRRWDAGVDTNGKRLRPTETFKGSASDADARLRELVSAVDKGTAVAPSKMTVAACGIAWLGYLAAMKKVSVRTHENYSHLFNTKVVPNLGATLLQKLMPADVEGLYDRLRVGDATHKPISGQSIKHVHRILFACMRFAIKRKLITMNPCADVERPPVVPGAIVVLGEEEMAAFLDGLAPREPTERDKSLRRWRMTDANRSFLLQLATLAACTGARRGELLALRWCDIDLAHGLVRVHRTVEETKALGVRIKSTKSGRERTITIPQELCESLARYRTQQKESWLLLKARPANEAEALLFPMTPERPDGLCSPSLCSKRFSSYAASAGLRGLKLHGLRHSHASQLVAAGYGIADVAKTLGHSTPAITLAIYSHAIKGAQEKMAATMGGMLGKRKTGG